MASKLDFLLQVLEMNDFRHLKDSLPKSKEKNFRDSNLSNQAFEIYKAMGGIRDEYPWEAPEWDLEFETFALKLDEAPQFNRYRGITLKAEIYINSPFFSLENYKRYCRQFEMECIKAAKHSAMWTDSESERYFGKSEESGDLALNGSAKWKQRAFFGFLEDVSATLLKIKLIRISIHDNIMINNKLVKLDTLLISQNPLNEKYLWNFLSRKIMKG